MAGWAISDSVFVGRARSSVSHRRQDKHGSAQRRARALNLPIRAPGGPELAAPPNCPHIYLHKDFLPLLAENPERLSWDYVRGIGVCEQWGGRCCKACPVSFRIDAFRAEFCGKCQRGKHGEILPSLSIWQSCLISKTVPFCWIDSFFFFSTFNFHFSLWQQTSTLAQILSWHIVPPAKLGLLSFGLLIIQEQAV